MIVINTRVHANHMPLLLLVQEQPQQYIPSQAPEYTTHPDKVLYPCLCESTGPTKVRH